MADKIVQLVDKNSNNLYPVAGAVIDNAVSTGAISSQAVTNAKIENGAVNGVANDATAIGTAKLALDTVGTPNLRDASVTSDKIDWTTFGNLTRFLLNSQSIENYSYTVSNDIKLAWAYVYFDANNVPSSFQVQLNNNLVGISMLNNRVTIPMIVKGGDVIKVVRWAGTTVPFHEGWIRRIF